MDGLQYSNTENPLGMNFASMMAPTTTATPTAKIPGTDQAALDAKAMQTILGMFNQASQADIAEMQAMRPQLMQAPGGAAPQAMHGVAQPQALGVMRPQTSTQPSLAQLLFRR